MSRERLLHLFDRMEEERQVLLRRLDALTPEQLEQRPPNGGWSVAQVVSHLNIAEKSSLAYLYKKLEVNKHEPVGRSAGWRLILLNTAIRLPLKYKAPTVVADVPPIAYATAREQWDRTRSGMRTAYSTLEATHVDHDLFKHPSAGRFSLAQGVRFMRQHMRRHTGQIDRILAALAPGLA